jgi:serine/threonine-protein kinase RsbW
MATNVTEHTEERLILRINLSEIAQVSPWIERLALQHSIPENVQFASNLCLEEVLSNIVLHGYGGEAEGAIIVRFEVPRGGCFLFVVEDQAPPFNPVSQPQLGALNPNEEMRVGGQGIRLLREFADALEYERLPDGNRLKVFFFVGSRPE